MKIGSTGAAPMGALSSPMRQSDDAVSRDIEKRIEDVKRRMQELSENERFSPEEKAKRRQELQKEISNLENELRQHEISLRREKRSDKGTSMDDMLGGEKPTQKGSETKEQEMSGADMKALISADTSMKQVQTQGSVKTALEGRAGVLEAEIMMDRGRGASTEKKEAELAATKQRAQEVTAAQMQTLSDIDEEFEEKEEENMSTIREYAAGNYYENQYESRAKSNAGSFLSGLNVSADSSSDFSLSDYAMIKNGSYRTLMKAYYAQEKGGGVSGDTSQKLTLMASTAGAAANAVKSLMSDSLWQKKEITEKDETTGEKTTRVDYDRTAITKTVKSFAENYNQTIEEAGKSNTRDVLRNAAWMTGTTSANRALLAKVGITVGAGNKLELDEDALKEADISTLRSIFSGQGSYASQILDKANAITNAAAGAGGTYTSSGTFTSALSQIVSGTLDVNS